MSGISFIEIKKKRCHNSLGPHGYLMDTKVSMKGPMFKAILEISVFVFLDHLPMLSPKHSSHILYLPLYGLLPMVFLYS